VLFALLLSPRCADDDPTEKILVMPKSGHNDYDVEFVIPEKTTGGLDVWTASTKLEVIGYTSTGSYVPVPVVHSP
jgi:hypothetical protein